jgi:hypothetical protein
LELRNLDPNGPRQQLAIAQNFSERINFGERRWVAVEQSIPKQQ